MTDDIPEPDRIGDAPHPRDTLKVFGHDATEAEIAATLASGSFPHAWLLTGPRGVGKATLAWRMARFLLDDALDAGGGMFGDAIPPKSLDVPRDSAVGRRIDALSEPGLLLIRRAWDADRKRLKTQVTVDEIRKINGFFGLSAAEGGHRVVVIDSADEMNPAAANAVLKLLEEPPRGAVLILISHQPARLLPTIRSRCRRVRLGTLSESELARATEQAGVLISDSALMAELSGGSVGEAIRLSAEDGLDIFSRITSLIETCPSLDRVGAMTLGEHVSQRGAEQRLDMTFQLLNVALSRLARKQSATHPGSARMWAALQQELSEQVTHARAVNIDAQSLLLDCFLKINKAVADGALTHS